MFEDLTSFESAIESLRVRSLLPSDLSSGELRKLASQIKRSSQFSAKVTNAKFLQGVSNVLESILNPVKDEKGATVGFSPATARDELRRLADGLGVDAIKDDARIDLIVDTQTDLAYGFGQHVQSNTETSREVFPCQELYRLGQRKVPRDWEQRWEDAGGEVLEGGRMVARKDDEIWQALGDGEPDYDDTLGNPYPPFAFNSGMWVQPVGRDEAIELGVIDEDEEPVAETKADFVDGLGAGVDTLDAGLKAALTESVGDGFKVSKGVLMASEGPLRVVRWNGLKIVVETEQGEFRHGIGFDGKLWSSLMPFPYGYFEGTRADDNQGLDVFVGPDPTSDRVFIVHQYNFRTKAFDELKTFVQFSDPESAKAAYQDSYSDGTWDQHFGSIEEKSVAEFVDWASKGNATVRDLANAYDPDQPRVPAGSPEGGQWGGGEGGSEWKPVMTDNEANNFSKGGAFSGETFYHSTKQENVESIEREGLRASDGIYGKGIYLSRGEEGNVSRIHADTQLKVAVKASNPLVVRGFGGLSRWMDANAPGQDDVKKALEKGNHDALVVKFSNKSDYVVVFDTKQVTVKK